MRKKRNVWRFGSATMGVVLAGCLMAAAAEADLGGTVTYTEPGRS